MTVQEAQSVENRRRSGGELLPRLHLPCVQKCLRVKFFLEDLSPLLTLKWVLKEGISTRILLNN